jgi:hypothetical protein
LDSARTFGFLFLCFISHITSHLLLFVLLCQRRRIASDARR